ncbi:hypothetical protein ACK3TF_001837 [Chlorella vulgaris]
MMIRAHTRLTTGASPGRKAASLLPRGSHNARHSLTSRHALHLWKGLRFSPPKRPGGVCLPAPHKRLLVSPLAAVKKPGDGPPRPLRPLNDVIVPVVLIVGLANWVRVIGTLFGPVGAIGVLSMLVTLVALCMIDFRE